jgi:hypothetical protein
VIPAGARCGVHVEVAAVDLCKRCGRFLCGDCVELAGEDAFCADCAKRQVGPASSMATAAMWLAAASVLVLVVPPLSIIDVVTAPSAAVVGAVELFLISRGRSSPRGRVRAVIALVVGGLVSLLVVGVIIFTGFIHRAR